VNDRIIIFADFDDAAAAQVTARVSFFQPF
jgi:hypothetical protein